MAKITIIDGNDEIELSTAPKENIKAYMVKGEPGTDGTSPTASVSKTGDTATITITDKNGTTQANVVDGFDPTITTSKTNKITTLTITDIDGTRTAEILDGIDLTGGVPTNGVIGFDGTAEDIPGGYVVTTDPFPGAGSINVNDSYSTSTTEPYSANYVNNAIPTISDSYSTSTTEPYSANYVNNLNSCSSDEVQCGTWFGKKKYRKSYYISALANTGTTYTPLNITNLSDIVDVHGTASNYSTFFPLPAYRGAQDVVGIQLYADTNNGITITTGNDRTSYHANITIEYTKTTD